MTATIDPKQIAEALHTTTWDLALFLARTAKSTLSSAAADMNFESVEMMDLEELDDRYQQARRQYAAALQVWQVAVDELGDASDEERS